MLTLAHLVHAPTGGRRVFTFDIVAVAGTELRRARLASASARRRGHVAILPGRCEHIEKYTETATDLTARGFDVAVVEWRAHGLSGGRRTDNRQKHHLDEFDQLVDDLETMLAGQGDPRLPKLLLAHSMGGLAAALHLARHPARYAAAVLAAPMFDIKVDPWPKGLARAAARAAVALGFAERYAFGQTDYDPAEGAFDPANRLTGDPARYAVLQDHWAERPDMRLGGVTFGWLDAAFRAMDKVTAGDGGLGAVSTPVLILSAPDDEIVDAASHLVVARRFPNARLVDFPGAKHELLMERDAIREKVWRAVDDFFADVLPQGAPPPCPSAAAAF